MGQDWLVGEEPWHGVSNVAFAGGRVFSCPRSALPAWQAASVAGALGLGVFGVLARIREMAMLERWAEAHWEELKEPLA